MKSLDIFSGAGGLASGLALAGFDHVSLIERDKYACASLRRNFNSEIVFEGDIADFDLNTVDNIDIVAGGPPCQPFSLGGKHGAYQDNRDMFPHAINCIERLQPKAFIFENVKGLLRASFAEYFAYIMLRLTYPHCAITAPEGWQEHLNRLKKITPQIYEGIRYKVTYKLLNAADYGVPQKRERVFIIGIRSDLDAEWQFPEPTHSEDSLNWEKHVTGTYWARHNLPAQSDADLAKALLHKYGIFYPQDAAWRTIRDTLCEIPEPYSKHGIPDHIFRDGAKTYPGHTGSAIDQPAKTLKAGDHGVPGGENMIRYPDGAVRYLTTYEAKLLQTFPDDFIVAGSWGESMRQIGNAVPVKLSAIIAKKLIHTLQAKQADT